MIEIIRTEEQDDVIVKIGRCTCGKEIELPDFTNECSCGRLYNWAGQALKPERE